MPINTATIAVVTITTNVELISSSLVDHATFPNSALTSFIKFIGFAIIFISLLASSPCLYPRFEGYYRSGRT